MFHPAGTALSALVSLHVLLCAPCEVKLVLAILLQMFDMGMSGVGPVRKVTELARLMTYADRGTSTANLLLLASVRVWHFISMLLEVCCLSECPPEK